MNNNLLRSVYEWRSVYQKKHWALFAKLFLTKYQPISSKQCKMIKWIFIYSSKLISCKNPRLKNLNHFILIIIKAINFFVKELREEIIRVKSIYISQAGWVILDSRRELWKLLTNFLHHCIIFRQPNYRASKCKNIKFDLHMIILTLSRYTWYYTCTS